MIPYAPPRPFRLPSSLPLFAVTSTPVLELPRFAPVKGESVGFSPAAQQAAAESRYQRAREAFERVCDMSLIEEDLTRRGDAIALALAEALGVEAVEPELVRAFSARDVSERELERLQMEDEAEGASVSRFFQRRTWQGLQDAADDLLDARDQLKGQVP